MLNERPAQVAENNELPTDIQGSPEFQCAIKTILEKHKRVFSAKVPDKPAYIKAMEINIDKEQWESGHINTGYRMRSVVKDTEIIRQVKLMLALGLIVPSKATRHSHVHLTPKPMDQWRFTIDFRYLNQCTTPRKSGYLPKIRDILNFVGSFKDSLQ
jgi:hypothetical protein